jgi:16S rRNA (cytosine967-C5)-methyltransferase
MTRSGGPDRPTRGNGPRKPPATARGLRVLRPQSDGPDGSRTPGSRPPPRKPGRGRQPSPDPARHAAALLIWAVLENRQTLDDAMAGCDPYRQLEPRDRGFAAAIVLATLRLLGHVDRLIGASLVRPLPETAHYVRALLRLSIGQWLAGLAPDHAIASSAVSLARDDRVAHGMAGLVNAVIRRVQRETDKAGLRPEDALSAPWAARWARTFGTERLAAMAGVLASQPPLDLSARPDFDISGLQDLDPVVLPGGAIRLARSPADIPHLPGWAEGMIWVQDAAARLPVLALGDVAGRTVLDMCAAPGGKTLQLAAAGAVVTAADSDARRMALVSENLARTGLAARCLVNDARTLEAETLFDAVLLDAPCSATGTGRRHPEAQWIRDPRDVTRLLGIQSQLIASAARLVRPGGTVVFAICSMESEEQEAALAAASGAGLVLDPLDASDCPGLPDEAFRAGTVHTAPDIWAGQGGMDGFFIARFKRA